MFLSSAQFDETKVCRLGASVSQAMEVEWRALYCTAGVSVRNNYDVNSLAVPRRAKEAIGAIALLKNEKSGHQMTINVEYNQLDPLLRATTHPQGDVNDDAGFSPFPGAARTEAGVACRGGERVAGRQQVVLWQGGPCTGMTLFQPFSSTTF